MTPDEFRQARLRLGLTNGQLATILDRTETTVSRWQSHTATARAPDPTACRVMRWLLDGYRPPEWPS